MKVKVKYAYMVSSLIFMCINKYSILSLCGTVKELRISVPLTKCPSLPKLYISGTWAKKWKCPSYRDLLKASFKLRHPFNNHCLVTRLKPKHCKKCLYCFSIKCLQIHNFCIVSWKQVHNNPTETEFFVQRAEKFGLS